MACATLKRNLEWEASQLPAKRRRCAPVATGSPSTSSGLKVSENKSSMFGESVSSKLTPETMAQEIYDEIKRLHRRRQLRVSGGAASSSSGSEGDCSPPRDTSTGHHHVKHSRVLFTFKQVRMIAERLLREQEAALRAEYETALSNKLAEQYEAFVRFNLDQVQRRPLGGCGGMDAEHHMHHDHVPSYLS